MTSRRQIKDPFGGITVYRKRLIGSNYPLLSKELQQKFKKLSRSRKPTKHLHNPILDKAQEIIYQNNW